MQLFRFFNLLHVRWINILYNHHTTHCTLHAACITSATHFIAASRTNQHMLNGSYRGELPLYLFRFMFSELNVFRGGYIGNSRNSMEMNVCIFTEFLESIQSNKYTLTVWLGWRPKFGFQLDAWPNNYRWSTLQNWFTYQIMLTLCFELNSKRIPFKICNCQNEIICPSAKLHFVDPSPAERYTPNNITNTRTASTVIMQCS